MTDRAVIYLLTKVVSNRDQIRRANVQEIRSVPGDLQTKAKLVKLQNSTFDRWLSETRKDLEQRGAVFSDIEWSQIINRSVGGY